MVGENKHSGNDLLTLMRKDGEVGERRPMTDAVDTLSNRHTNLLPTARSSTPPPPPSPFPLFIFYVTHTTTSQSSNPSNFFSLLPISPFISLHVLLTYVTLFLCFSPNPLTTSEHMGHRPLMLGLICEIYVCNYYFEDHASC